MLGEDEKMIQEKNCSKNLKQRPSKLKGYSQDLVKQTLITDFRITQP